jgi:hypothetical protein
MTNNNQDTTKKQNNQDGSNKSAAGNAENFKNAPDLASEADKKDANASRSGQSEQE